MKTYKNINFCLGIDPNPIKNDLDNFRDAVYAHMEILDFSGNQLKDKILKPQLSYFLSFGSNGIAMLEEFVDRYRDKYTIIIDGKFNDISNTMNGYFNFVFQTLKAHGMTINPFLGQKSMQLAFETCAKSADSRGRVYVLCATSEQGTNELSFLQDNWKQTLKACEQIKKDIFNNHNDFEKLIGVVVGANRVDVLFSQELKDSQLSVLAPGLGTQGGEWKTISKCAQLSNEITFPVSRSIFDGGNIPLEKMQDNLVAIQRYF